MGVAWLIRCCLLPAVSMLLLSCCFVALLLLIACIRLSRCSGKVIRARKSTGLSGQGNNILTVSLILELVLGLIRCCSVSSFLRKEVIQPHLPVRLPCYDFTPLTGHTLDGSLLKGWAAGFGCTRLGWCDGRCVQGPGTYSPRLG